MIEFHCFDPEVAEKWPIVPAHDIQFEWVKKAKQWYKENPREVMTTKCPGIFSLMSLGWIQRAYQDFEITPEIEGFYWKSKVDQTKQPGGNYTGPYIEGHTAEQLYQFKNWPANTHSSVIKIASPWMVKIPEGYSLLVMPIPYHDEVRFTAASGIIKGTNFLNVQMYWHCRDTTEVIKEGTPLNQMMLLKNEKVPSMIKVISEPDSSYQEKNNFPLIWK
jgi:hypothetical protein